jgi:hypothetical protein
MMADDVEDDAVAVKRELVRWCDDVTHNSGPTETEKIKIKKGKREVTIKRDIVMSYPPNESGGRKSEPSYC